MERIERFSQLVEGGVQVFVYTPSEVARMMREYHVLLLDALKDGIPIYDRGIWATLQASLKELIRQGKIRPAPRGWDISL